MGFIGWPEAVAFIGSIGTLAGVAYKIVAMKSSKSTDQQDVCKAKIQRLETDQAVQEEQMSNLKEENDRLHTGFDKINDLLLRLLSDK